MYGRAIYIRPTSLVMPVGYNNRKVLYLLSTNLMLIKSRHGFNSFHPWVWVTSFKPEPQEPGWCKTKQLLHAKERIPNDLQLHAMIFSTQLKDNWLAILWQASWPNSQEATNSRQKLLWHVKWKYQYWSCVEKHVLKYLLVYGHR